MTTAIAFDVGRLTKTVEETRKDALSIDFARLIGTHFARMVEHFSKVEGRPVSAHNNKTLFLEGIDIWCRRKLGCSGAAAPGQSWTEDPKDVVRASMRPWYEALDLQDPSRYRMGSCPPCPAYVGRHEDATAYFLGLCSCLEVGPVALMFGKTDGVYEHVWAKVMADRRWYESDLSNPEFKLGDHYEFQDYEEVEIPL